MDDRTRIAAMALQGLISSDDGAAATVASVTESAVDLADALLDRLAETTPGNAPGPVVAGPATDETEAERRGDNDWSEAFMRAIGDALEILTARGEGDEEMSCRIARAAIAVDRAERLATRPDIGLSDAVVSAIRSVPMIYCDDDETLDMDAFVDAIARTAIAADRAERPADLAAALSALHILRNATVALIEWPEDGDLSSVSPEVRKAWEAADRAQAVLARLRGGVE